jgi:hypothetical protein
LLILGTEAVNPPEQLQTQVGLFLDVRGAGLDVVLIFIGTGGTVFFYLFFKSRYLPKLLATWGMLTYLTMLMLSFVNILLLNLPESTKMIF